jgi:prefoldin subunit 5
MSKIVSKRWMSGHDMYIKLFAESIINNDEPLVSVIDGLAVAKTLEEACLRIERLKGTSKNSIVSTNQEK